MLSALPAFQGMPKGPSALTSECPLVQTNASRCQAAFPKFRNSLYLFRGMPGHDLSTGRHYLTIGIHTFLG
jgi:hypothetical protein